MVNNPFEKRFRCYSSPKPRLDHQPIARIGMSWS
jgi:hypothetical protein